MKTIIEVVLKYQEAKELDAPVFVPTAINITDKLAGTLTIGLGDRLLFTPLIKYIGENKTALIQQILRDDLGCACNDIEIIMSAK